jgi:uncharacterized membrane protein YkvA (DUF1232 family)
MATGDVAPGAPNGASLHALHASTHEAPGGEAQHEPAPEQTRLQALKEKLLRRLARRNLLLLAAKGNWVEALRDIPEQMHRVARETQLVIEFVDDVRARRYRAPWWAVAVAATALLYPISPADAVPNFIPIAGIVDDLAVIAVATRVLRGELKKYCVFKGYPVSEYF